MGVPNIGPDGTRLRFPLRIAGIGLCISISSLSQRGRGEKKGYDTRAAGIFIRDRPPTPTRGCLTPGELVSALAVASVSVPVQPSSTDREKVPVLVLDGTVARLTVAAVLLSDMNLDAEIPGAGSGLGALRLRAGQDPPQQTQERTMAMIGWGGAANLRRHELSWAKLIVEKDAEAEPYYGSRRYEMAYGAIQSSNQAVISKHR
ncbi:hypothetical protein ACLOJK_013861 [Asimina triloba]